MLPPVPRSPITGVLWSLLAIAGCLDSSGNAPAGVGPAADGAASPALTDGGFVVDPEEPLDTSGEPYACSAGVLDVTTGVDFAELEPGGGIPIGGTGQAGLTARMALRMQADSDPGETMVELILTNVLDGTQGESVLADRPVVLDCGADGFCYVVPVLVEISHLAKLPELEGLPIRVDVTVREAGDSERVLCRARNHGVLERVL
jgi:hypothetical protein